MTNYEIAPGALHHVKPLSRYMRAAGYAAMQAYGYDPRRAVRRAFLESGYVRTALIDGEPVAMWGIRGVALSDVADVWLVIASSLRHMPIAIMREARRELAAAAKHFREITATMLPDDETSVRFAIRLGFRGDVDSGSEEEIMTDALTNPRYRVPLGDNYGVALSYRVAA